MSDSTINFVASFKAGAATSAAKAFRGELGNLHGAVNKVGDKMLGVIKTLAKFALVAGTALVAAVGISTKKAEDYGVTVAKVVKITGLAVDVSSKLVATFQRYGLEGDAAIRTLGMLEKNVGLYTATAKVSKKFTDQFGFALRDSSGHVKDANTLILQAADYFNNKHIPASQRALLEAKLFGRSWQALVPILALGSAGIKAAGDQAQKLGLVLSKSNAADLLAYHKSTIGLGEAMGGLQLSIGLAVMPALIGFIGFITGEVIPRIRDAGAAFAKWLTDNAPLIAQIKAFVAGVLTNLVNFLTVDLPKAIDQVRVNVTKWYTDNKPLVDQLTGLVSGVVAKGIQTIVDTFGNMGPTAPIILGVTAAVLLLNAAVRANPIVAILSGIVVAVGLFATAWESDFGNIRERAQWMFQSIQKGYDTYLKPVFSAIHDVIWNVVKPAFALMIDWAGRIADFLWGNGKGPLPEALKRIGIAFRAFVDILKTVFSWVKDVIGAVATAIDRLTHLDKIGKTPFGPKTTFGPNLPHVGSVGVPHAAGGWVGLHGPELSWLGEKGPEYVVPNNKLGTMGGGVTGVTIAPIININSVFPPSAADGQRIARDLTPELVRELRRQRIIA